MIDLLKKTYENLLNKTNLNFQRATISQLKPKEKGPIALVGERGVGKTYMLLQLLKKTNKKGFYFSADNPLVRPYSLYKIVSSLYFDYNIRFLTIDEIHKGKDWISNLKSIIDSFPDLDLIVSGSSSLDLYKGTSDLQRRIYNINLSTLSFKEFLKYDKNISIPSISFEELITNYKSISYDLEEKVNIQDFKNYLKYGFYPYFKNKKDIYHTLLAKNLQKTILEDIPTFMNIQSKSLSKIEKLFYYIAKNKPSDLNYNNLSKKIKISKELLESIVIYLDKIGIINLAIRSNKLSNILRKEFKMFLGNPNMHYSYITEPELGTIRESFVLQALKRVSHHKPFNENIILPNYGDFVFSYNDKKYLFEVGGYKKTSKQIKGIDNAFLVKDDIQIGKANQIPIWLFGLLD